MAISDGYSRLAVGHAMGERATVELANAVADAVAPFGTELTELPHSSERTYSAVRR